MKRRLLVLAALAGFLGGFHEWTPPAHADVADDCGVNYVAVSSWSIGGDSATTLWDFQCGGGYNVQWNVELTLQYQNSLGGWQAFGCDNGQKCQTLRPTSGWYDPATRHSGENHWNVAGQLDCHAVRFHAEVLFLNTGVHKYNSLTYQIGGC